MSDINSCVFCRSPKTQLWQGGKLHYVSCGSCFAIGPTAQTEAQAIRKWNIAEPLPARLTGCAQDRPMDRPSTDWPGVALGTVLSTLGAFLAFVCMIVLLFATFASEGLFWASAAGMAASMFLFTYGLCLALDGWRGL